MMPVTALTRMVRQRRWVVAAAVGAIVAVGAFLALNRRSRVRIDPIGGPLPKATLVIGVEIVPRPALGPPGRGDGETIELDPGSGVRRTLVPNLAGALRISPDGRQIAYASFPGDVWIANRDGSAPRRIPIPVGRPAWSPDGRAIVCTHEGSPGTGTRSAQTYLCRLDQEGAQPELLLLPPNEFVEDWSPDGRWLGVTCWDDPAPQKGVQIGLRSPDGKEFRHLTTEGYQASPRFMPDGRRVVFAGEGGIYLIDLDGSHRERIHPLPGEWFGPCPAPSPDGRFIAIRARGQAGGMSVAIVGIDGKDPRTLSIRVRRPFDPLQPTGMLRTDPGMIGTVEWLPPTYEGR